MGSLKNAPDVPDPQDIVSAQTGTNIGTTLANAALGNVKTVTPYGKTTFKERDKAFKYTDPYTGEVYKIPQFKEVSKLSPEGRKQFDLQQDTTTNLLGLARDQSAQLGSYLSKPFSLGQFDFGADLGVGAYKPGGLQADVFQPGGAMSTSPLADRGDIALPEGVRTLGSDKLTLGNEATESRLFDLGSRRLDPRFAREKDSLQSSLLARGIREGSDAWKAAMGQFGETQNDAYNQLLLTGRGQAAAETQAEYDARTREQETAFGQAVSGRQLTAAEQNQRFGQELAGRGLTAAEQAQQFGQALQLGQFGMNEQAQQFGQTLADRQRMLAERGQQTSEAFATRSQPINEIAALLGTGQVTVPQLTGQQQPQTPITDTAGIINNNWEQQFKAWQAESQATQGMLGGLFGAAGNILSDRRLKDDIEQVGQTPDGLPIYEFRVGNNGEMQSGVMAQDVEKVMPEAVAETPEGIKTVNYDMAVGAGDGTYTVQKGDTLWDIGKRFNAPVPDIVAANAIRNPDMIQPGQVLKIPGMAAPGPEAIRYDPLSSANAGVPAVASALGEEGPNDIDTMTETDEHGNYLMPPNVGGARPEMGAGGMPAAPWQPTNMAPASSPIMADPLAGMDQSIDQSMGEQKSRLLARELMRNRTGMEAMTAPPPRPPAAAPPALPVGTVEAGSTGGEFFSPQPVRPAPPPVPPVAPMAAGPEPIPGTVGAGATGGEFFSPQPMRNVAPDPLAGRVSQTFDLPTDAMIMNLMQAFQNRMPFIGAASVPALGGF